MPKLDCEYKSVMVLCIMFLASLLHIPGYGVSGVFIGYSWFHWFTVLFGSSSIIRFVSRYAFYPFIFFIVLYSLFFMFPRDIVMRFLYGYLSLDSFVTGCSFFIPDHVSTRPVLGSLRLPAWVHHYHTTLHKPIVIM